MSRLALGAPGGRATRPMPSGGLRRSCCRRWCSSPSCFSAAFAEVIAPHRPFDLASLDLLDARLPRGIDGGVATYWLGTDGQGRDAVGVMFGLRISLLVGLLSVAVSGWSA